MQPIIKDKNGHARFKANAVVRLLLDESQMRGFGLNELAGRDLPQADWEQFYQLIGYSLTGYHELSNVSDQSAIDTSVEARKTIPQAGGCRDDGCAIHIGVERESEQPTR